MTWVRLDDAMTEHPKCVGLSPFAWTLWVHALCYSSRNLTDGHIPQAMLSRLSALREPEPAAAELVDAGLWRVEKDGGWVIHDYLSHQRSRSQVQEDRDAAARRQREARERRNGAAKQRKE